jgi:hypothetical protein
MLIIDYSGVLLGSWTNGVVGTMNSFFSSFFAAMIQNLFDRSILH